MYFYCRGAFGAPKDVAPYEYATANENKNHTEQVHPPDS